MLITISEESFNYRRDCDTLESGQYEIVRHIFGVPFTDYADYWQGVGVVWYEDKSFETVSE